MEFANDGSRSNPANEVLRRPRLLLASYLQRISHTGLENEELSLIDYRTKHLAPSFIILHVATTAHPIAFFSLVLFFLPSVAVLFTVRCELFLNERTQGMEIRCGCLPIHHVRKYPPRTRSITAAFLLPTLRCCHGCRRPTFGFLLFQPVAHDRQISIP